MLPYQDAPAVSHFTPSGKKFWRFTVFKDNRDNYMEVAIPDGALMNDISCPVLMWHHGAQTTATMPWNGAQYNQNATDGMSGFACRFMVENWILVSSNCWGSAAWGFSHARDGAIQNLQWIKENLHAMPPGLYGVSMGGLTSLGLIMDAKRLGLEIMAFCGNSPVTHIRQQYDTNQVERTDMKSRYGITESGTFGSPALYSNGPQYQALIDHDGPPYFGHDPQEINGAPRLASDFVVGPYGNQMPVQIWEGGWDTTVVPSKNGVLFAQILRDAGWLNVEEVPFGTGPTNGGHVGTSSYNSTAADKVLGPGGFFATAFPGKV